MPPSSPFSLRTGIYPTIDPKSLEGSLAGKNALVTGSSRGIGRHIANALAQAGANIAITGRSGASVESAVQEVSTHGTQVIGVTGDVLKLKDLEHLVKKVTDSLGAIDILVLNAGTNIFLPFHQTNSEDWWRIMELNVRSPVDLTRLVLPSMQLRNSGTVIFTSSRAATASLPWTSSYNCSKTAITRFAGTLQAELDTVQKVEGHFDRNGIEFFSFHPGEIETDLHTTGFPKCLETDAPYVLEHMDRVSANRPHFEPELPAWTVVFLASGRAAALKGQYVDATRDLGEVIAAAEKGSQHH